MAVTYLPTGVTFGQLVDLLGPIAGSIVRHQPHFASIARPGPPPIVRRIFLADPLVDASTLLAAQTAAAANHADVVLAPDPAGVLSSASTPLAYMLVSVIGLSEQIDADDLQLRVAELVPDTTDAAGATEVARETLIGIADRLASALGGHVLVEDSDFQLLGYSRLTDDTDVARREAILQRQLPSRYQQIFNSQGVLARLVSGEDVVATEAAAEHGLGRRLIVAIRPYDQLLGTIWLARDEPRFTDDDIREMRHAAEDISALLVDTLRIREDLRIRHDDAARTLLSGRRPHDSELPDAIRAALPARAAHVVAISVADPDDDAPMIRLHGIRVLLEVSARSLRMPLLTVIEADVVHALHFGCGANAGACTSDAPRLLAQHVMDSLRVMGVHAAIGIGRHIDAGGSLAPSAASARAVLALLRAEQRAGVTTAQQEWATLWVHDLIGGLELDGDALPRPLLDLLTGSAARHVDDRRTLRVALDQWGDVAGIAAELHVHANTVRYRLQRIAAQYELALDRPHARFAVWALLRARDDGAVIV